MLRIVGCREAPAGSSLLSPERKRHAMRCPERALLLGYQQGDSGLRVSFLDLFLSWRWIVGENRIEVREDRGVDHERAVADFEAQDLPRG